MAKIKYALEKGGPKRLEISWTGNWKNVSIRLDGNEIGTFADAEEMKAGKEFTLPDGSSLKIQLERTLKFPLIQILRDGKPLPTGMPQPAKRLSMAYQMVFLIGAVNLIGGLTNKVFQSRLLGLSVSGLYLIIAGCIFLILGFFVMKKSKIALSIAVGLIFIDMISLIFLIFVRSSINFILLIVMIAFRLIILLILAQAFGAIKILKQNPANSAK